MLAILCTEASQYHMTTTETFNINKKMNYLDYFLKRKKNPACKMNFQILYKSKQKRQCA